MDKTARGRKSGFVADSKSPACPRFHFLPISSSVVKIASGRDPLATAGTPMRPPYLTYVLIVCLACSGCADQIQGAILAGAYVITIPQQLQAERAKEEKRRRREALSREEYGRRNCPEAFLCRYLLGI
ncbi:MAG: hypothetical protein LBM64_01330 [Deltaproteobacteria bacterium]|jgi:hypothetical protein|nr:hypothetical protein [Deltaproteobacteria bacterium]